METLRMSRKERRRLELLSRVKRRELRLSQAAELLGVSVRQAKRIYARYRLEADAGLVHRLRGRPSNRAGDAALRERALALYREKYADFGPTFAAEQLARRDGVSVSTTSLRRWLVAAGLWQARRARAEHRRWRARKEHFGEMSQMDGSHHDWFEGRRPKAVLMVLIDDATNRTWARFFEEETTVAAMTTFAGYVREHGLPRSLYVDRAAIYEPTRDATVDEELAESGPLTQFGRAMQDLEVKLILARSPQAKGRVERRHAVFQDRLVKELRLSQVNDLPAANRYLEETFLPELNRRFTVAPAQSLDLHRRRPPDSQLDRALSFQELRLVQNDWTLQWRNRCLQLTEANRKLALVKRRVLVSEQLDGAIRLWHGDRELEWEELPERPQRPAAALGGPTGTGRVGRRPAANHPWRTAPGGRARLSAGTPGSAPVA